MASDLVYDSSLVAVVVRHDTIFEFARLSGTFGFNPCLRVCDLCTILTLHIAYFTDFCTFVLLTITFSARSIYPYIIILQLFYFLFYL